MMKADDLSSYDVIVGYGIGQNYEKIKSQLKGRITFHYLADKKWENSDIKEYDGIPVIDIQTLKQLERALVVLFPKFSTLREVIERELSGNDIAICYIHDLFAMEYSINSADLIKLLPEKKYHDEFHNCVVFDDTLPENITIFFQGKNNLLRLGRDLSVGHLEIHLGNNAVCIVGNHTSVLQSVYWVSDAELNIGEDCMFSSGVVVKTHDGHHIFDKLTHERINVSKNVIIENQVWIGCEAVLLAGAHIGAGSVVGARAVTSSGFGDHMLIAGCPAKAVRENICWSRDNTESFQRSRLEECIDQSALKYL